MLARYRTSQPQQQIGVPFGEPAPVNGIDDNASLYGMPAGTAIYLYNLVPGPYGCLTRPGYRTWAQNLSGGAVRGLIPFTGLKEDGTESRLFASTTNGIFDVSTQATDNPSAVVVFPDQTGQAGFVQFVNYTDSSGLQTVLVADGQNGLYEYDPTGPIWVKYNNTMLQGVDPTKVVFILVHKNRLWFIEKDSADAWYLPVGQKQGTATKFQFGVKFRYGGNLVGLFPWTIEGGSGADDYLLATSRAGDLLAYQGEDPAQSSTWRLVGSWFIGQVPTCRCAGLVTGGDTLLLSVFGVISVASLLQGLEPTKIDRNITGKVSNLLQQQLKTKITEPHWQIKILPEEEVIVVTVPTVNSEAPIQFVLNVNRLSEGPGGGWGIWRGLPMTAVETYLQSTFFGTKDGKVHQLFGSLDDVAINGVGGSVIPFSGLLRYTDDGMPAKYKQVTFLRPVFQSSNISFSSKALYDFDIREIISSLPAPEAGNRGQWDLSNWDQAVWSGQSVFRPVQGTGGYGVNFAVAIRGETNARSTLIAVEGEWVPWNSFL